MPLIHLINGRKLFFLYQIALGLEDTCTPWTLYSCSAFGPKPKEDRSVPTLAASLDFCQGQG